MVEYVVLVTGASGFLGQHIIKHLHLYSDNVKEIRVLDLSHYQQKLDFKTSKPMKIFTGSINDNHVVREACCGTDIVLHIASLIDWSLFPNNKALHEVNVVGTQTVINACRAENVPYLIYCGSSGLFNGPEEVINGNESTVKKPSKYYFPAYASTKAKAQNLVLTANDTQLSNGKILKTMAILPLPMYGELDLMAVPLSIRPFKGGTYPRTGKLEAKLQYCYVGNVAMVFVEAAKAFPKTPEIGGNFFFAADDTPIGSLPEIMKPYLDMVNSKVSTWYIPYWFLTLMLLLLYIVLFVIRLFKSVHLPNLHFTFGSIAFINTTFNICYDKSTTMLGYKPLYDYETAIRRSKAFYLDVI